MGISVDLVIEKQITFWKLNKPNKHTEIIYKNEKFESIKIVVLWNI